VRQVCANIRNRLEEQMIRSRFLNSLRQSISACLFRGLLPCLLFIFTTTAGCRQTSSGISHTKPDDDPKVKALIKKAKEYEDEKEFPEAEKTYQEAIAAGSAKAAVMQAGMYWDWEPDKNAQKMFALYKIAADRGDSDGEVFLGMAYERGGYRNKPEPAKAIPLYEQAAKQNNPGGFYHLGTAYIFGVGGLERNYVKAKDLLTRATNIGDDLAPIMLAKLYSYGQGGIKEDHAKAIALLKEAARKNEFSGIELAKEYLYAGLPSLAVSALKQCAADNFDAALAILACCYHEGLGVPQNESRARALLQKAQGAGDPYCKEALEQLKHGKNDAWKTFEIRQYGNRLELSV